MQGYTIEEWAALSTEERVEAYFEHYSAILENMRNAKEEIDMNDYTTVRAILIVITNIRGHNGSIT